MAFIQDNKRHYASNKHRNDKSFTCGRLVKVMHTSAIVLTNIHPYIYTNREQYNPQIETKHEETLFSGVIFVS